MGPVLELFKEDTVLYEENSRHEALLRVMESLLGKLAGMPLEEIRQVGRMSSMRNTIQNTKRHRKDLVL